MSFGSVFNGIKQTIVNSTESIRNEDEKDKPEVVKDGGKATANGEGAKATAKGEDAEAKADGVTAEAIADGKNAKATAEGEYALANANGENASARAKGKNAGAAASGTGATAEADGEDVAAVAMGNYARAFIKDSKDSELNVVGESARGEITGGSDGNSVLLVGALGDVSVTGDSDENMINQSGIDSSVVLENDADGNLVTLEGNNSEVNLDGADNRYVNVAGDDVRVDVTNEGVRVYNNATGDLLEESIYDENGEYSYSAEGIDITVSDEIPEEAIEEVLAEGMEVEETDETGETETTEEGEDMETPLSWSEARAQRGTENAEAGGPGTIGGDIASDLESSEDQTYTVQSGDTLWEVAEATYRVENGMVDAPAEDVQSVEIQSEIQTRVDAIAEQNSIADPNMISVGQVLDLSEVIQEDPVESMSETYQELVDAGSTDPEGLLPANNSGSNTTEESEEPERPDGGEYGSDTGAPNDDVTVGSAPVGQATPDNIDDVPENVQTVVTSDPRDVVGEINNTYDVEETTFDRTDDGGLYVITTGSNGETVQFEYQQVEGGNNGSQGVPDHYKLNDVTVNGNSIQESESPSTVQGSSNSDGVTTAEDAGGVPDADDDVSGMDDSEPPTTGGLPGDTVEERAINLLIEELNDPDTKDRLNSDYHAEDIQEIGFQYAGDSRPEYAEAGQFLQNRDNAAEIASLTALDGNTRNDLNSQDDDELANISDRLANGESFDDLVAEAEGIINGDYKQGEIQSYNEIRSNPEFADLDDEQLQALSQFATNEVGFEEGEIATVTNLIDQGFTPEQLISFVTNGNRLSLYGPTVLYNEASGGLNVNATDGENDEAIAAIDLLIEELDDPDTKDRLNSNYHAEDIQEIGFQYAGDARGSYAATGQFLQDEDNAADLEVLTFLDGKRGELNENELNDILNLLDAGVSFEYLVAEAEAIRDGRRQDSDLFHLFDVEQLSTG